MRKKDDTTLPTGMAAIKKIAVKKETKSTDKNDDMVVITVDDNEDVATAIDKYEAAKKRKKEAEAEMSIAQGIILPYCDEYLLKEYNKTGKCVESFIVSNKNKNSLIYIPMDAYKNIDKEKANYLKKTYSKKLVDTNNVYYINKDMTQKYGNLIADAIMKIRGIPKKDQGLIISSLTTYNIKKGTINKLKDIAETASVTIRTLWTEIAPTRQLKSPGDNK